MGMCYRIIQDVWRKHEFFFNLEIWKRRLWVQLEKKNYCANINMCLIISLLKTFSDDCSQECHATNTHYNMDFKQENLFTSTVIMAKIVLTHVVLYPTLLLHFMGQMNRKMQPTLRKISYNCSRINCLHIFILPFHSFLNRNKVWEKKRTSE